MKKRFLSVIIAAALLIPQSQMMAMSVKAAENVSLSQSVNNEISAKANIIVDASLSGESGQLVNGIKTVKTVGEALESVPSSNDSEYIIFIKNGTYKEKLKINKPNITMVGESSKGTILTFDDASGTIKRAQDGGDGTSTYGTSNSASVTISSSAKGFSAANITFENGFDEMKNSAIKNQQAVAVKNEADQSAFYNCRFIGNQDTLYANKNKQLYKNCYIEGDVDFIFGAAQAVFDGCEIFSIDRANAESKGYVTAPSTLASNKYGYLIQNSKLTTNITENGTIFLGRPWHPSSATEPLKSNVVYKNCEMGSHISKEGWTSMETKVNGEKAIINPSTENMLEYGSTGKGALTSDTRKLMTEKEAATYTAENVLAGWDFNSKVDELASYKESASNDVSGEKTETTTKENQAEKVQWNQTRFGITTSEEQNKISVDEANKTVTLSSGQKDGSATGGKVTGSNDGISYYYTELSKDQNFELTADVRVDYFEKAKPDKQCAFGIMARDTLGVANDVSIAPSNEVIVGGYKGMVQSVYRDGVTPNLDSKITMNGVHKFGDRPVNDGTATYKLSLKKTNTGYIASVNDGEEVTYYVPDLLESVESDKFYLGFFTARVAGITVSNIDLKLSNEADDPAGEKAPEVKVTPKVNVKSASSTGTKNYNLALNTNVEGTVKVSQEGKEIYNGKIDSNLAVPAELNKGLNNFTISYETKDGEKLNDISYVVDFKSYGVEQGDVYVSQNGTAEGKGTVDSPIDIYTAVKYTGDGQTIKVKGGTYNLTEPITIEKGNDGTEKTMKTLTTYDGERAIFDFGSVSDGITLDANYWHIKGVDFCNTADTKHGFTLSGNNNIIEDVKTYKNGDTGLQISGDQELSMDEWPSNNLILNCESYDNMDAAMNNADGFAAKLAVGTGNVFRGCIAHNNCDDGWDLFSKLELGAIGAVTIEDSIAYGNGDLSDGTVTKGDGNGFKLGGEGIPVKHTLKNSLSFDNNHAGITGNSNPAIVVEGCTSVDNDVNYSLDYYTNVKLLYKFDNNISYMTENSNNDFIPDVVKGETNYFYDGETSQNSLGNKLSSEDFKSLEKPSSFERDENGNIIRGDYMVLKDKEADIPGENVKPGETEVPGENVKPGEIEVPSKTEKPGEAEESNESEKVSGEASNEAKNESSSNKKNNKTKNVKTGDMGAMATAAFAGLGFIGMVRNRKRK